MFSHETNLTVMGHVMTVGAFLTSYACQMWDACLFALLGYFLAWLSECFYLNGNRFSFAAALFSVLAVAGSWFIVFGRMLLFI